MTSPMAIGAAAIGGVLLLESLRPKPPPGAALSAAASYLAANANVSGVTWNAPAGASCEDWFNAMCAALTQQHGNLGAFSDYPSGLSLGDLDQILGLYLGAWSAGCGASSTSTSNAGATDYNLTKVGTSGVLPGITSGGCDLTTCGDAVDPANPRTSLGDAVCACSAQRSSLATESSGTTTSPSSSDNLWGTVAGGVQAGATGASAQDVTDTLDKVRELARQLDGADGISNLWQDTSEGLGAFLYDAVTYIPGKVGDAVLGAVTSSPWFWAAAAIGGVVAWRYLR